MEKEKLISLVRATQNGDEAAFTALYESFHSDIYYHILKNVDNDTELAADLTQETFIEIMQTIGDLKEPAAFVTWSQRIAYHQCTAYFRKRHEMLADESEDGHSVFDGIEEDRMEFIPGEALDREEFKQAILSMINALPPEQRSAIMLRYFNEVSVKDIAQIQGVSEGTVKSRLNYGRKAIKDEVEKYEKNNNVKLHCVGVVPMLLWLLKELKRTSGKTLTSALSVAEAEAAVSGIATVACATTATATAVTATTTAATATSAATTTTVAAASGFLTKKGIAIALAAVVSLGGTAAVVLPQLDNNISSTVPTTILTTEPSTTPTAAPVEQPVVWYGYGMDVNRTLRRFDLTVDEMDDTNIRGQLRVSRLYEDFHVTNFEGTGILENGNIKYTLTFEVPAYGETISGFGYTATVLYDQQAQTIQFTDCYDATLKLMDYTSLPFLEKDAKWSGIGEDGFDLHAEGHLFELDVYEMTEAEIRGQLTMTKDGVVEHLSEFYGRGYASNGKINYEINLETPRTMEYFGTHSIDFFWLYYDIESDAFSFDGTCHYSAKMTREE